MSELCGTDFFNLLSDVIEPMIEPIHWRYGALLAGTLLGYTDMHILGVSTKIQRNNSTFRANK